MNIFSANRYQNNLKERRKMFASERVHRVSQKSPISLRSPESPRRKSPQCSYDFPSRLHRGESSDFPSYSRGLEVKIKF